MDILETYPFLFPVFFMAMWIFVLSALSMLGGWGALKEHYSSDGTFDGSKAYMQSLSMERLKFMPVNYSGIVTFGTNTEGVHLSVWFLFRLFHSSIFILYTDIIGRERKNIVFKVVEIRTSKNPDVKITISAKQARWMEEASDGAWTCEKRNSE